MLKNMLFWFFIYFFTIIFKSYSNTDSLDALKSEAGGLFSGFSGNFTLVSASGQLSSGKIDYHYPNKIRIIFSNGKNIITDGRSLWLYNPNNLICVKQDVAGSSGGMFSLLKSYNYERQGKRHVFINEKKHIKRIVIATSKGMLKNIKLVSKNGETTITFSNIIITKRIKSSLFYFKNVDAQVIENPLNNWMPKKIFANDNTCLDDIYRKILSAMSILYILSFIRG